MHWPPFLYAHTWLHFVLLGFSFWFFSAQPETSLKNPVCFCVQFGTFLKLPAIKAFTSSHNALYIHIYPAIYLRKGLKSITVISEILPTPQISAATAEVLQGFPFKLKLGMKILAIFIYLKWISIKVCIN